MLAFIDIILPWRLRATGAMKPSLGRHLLRRWTRDDAREGRPRKEHADL